MLPPLGVWGFRSVFTTGRRINFRVFSCVFLSGFQKYVKIRVFLKDNCENHALYKVFPMAGSCVFSRVFEGSADEFLACMFDMRGSVQKLDTAHGNFKQRQTSDHF